MVEALHTTASTSALWALVVLMSLLTVVLVSAPLVADSVQTRVVNRRRRMGVLGQQVTSDSTVTETGAAAAVGVAEPVPGNVPSQRTGEARREETQPDTPQSDVPTRADLPAQRGGEGDQAEFHQEPGSHRQAESRREPGDRDHP